MNWMLPLLVALSLGGFAFRRRSEPAAAWAVAGLAGAALLAPALALPGGIPSPSATLARLPPWQQPAATPGGIPDLVDVTFQVEPWLLHLRRELHSGRFPLWNPHQSSGAPYFANGSSAPLFPLHLLFALLPLQAGFVLLPWLRLALGGLGAYRLARETSVSHDGALLAAVIYPLSGRFASFLLFPMGNALCLAPWVFLGVERIARGRGGWRLLAAAAGLQLLAGHPETAVFTGLASALYLLVRGCGEAGLGPGEGTAGRRTAHLACWARFGAGWATGAALSAVQTVPLALTLVATNRWQEWHPGEAPSLGSVFTLWLRFLLPDAFGHAADGSYWGPFSFVPTTVYAGALTLPLAAAGAAAAMRDRQARGLAAMTGLCLVAAYHLPGFRQLLLALPILQKGLHHYLLLAVELGLALLAARGLDRFRRGEAGRSVLVGAALVLGGLAGGWLAFGSAWRAHDQLAVQGASTAVVGLAAVGLAAACRLGPPRRGALAPLLVALTAADLALAHARSNPGLPADALYPPTPAVAFLAGRPERLAATDFVLRPNAAMVYGLYDVRGDDSLKLRRYEAVYAGELGGGHPTFFAPLTRWQSPWLDRLGVRWVMAPPGRAPSEPDWRVAYTGPDAVVFERPGAWPLARFEGGAGEGRLAIERREPGLWVIAWEAAAPRLLVVAETWDPGWRARLDGRPRPTEAVDGVLMGIRVGPGAGRLTLRHLPAGLGWGAAVSLLGLAALGLVPRLGGKATPSEAPPAGAGRPGTL